MARYRRNPTNVFDEYYELQAGGNGMAYFQGSPYQRGHGIGSFLGGLFRGALPLLKSGARAVGKELLQCGINVLDDLPEATLKDSVNTRTGKAVQKGYQLKQIYEVWSYKSTQYDKNTKKGGLFSEYIDLFSTIKQKSSGYPPNVRTDEDKKKFVKELYDREGITLKVDEIQSNPGLRSLSKLCLNSLWGKFGQRNNVGSTTIIDSQATLFQYLEDPSKEISSIMFMPGRDGNDIAYVNWKVIEECAEDSNFINPIICAHVTAEARLVLYEYLEKLGNRVLYCDTDSIIYTELPHDLKIETGPFLGQMGDELATEYGEGAYITEFICGGPKNYGYCVKTAKNEYKYVVKIRGITLNHQVSKSLNFENMKEFILNPPPNPVQVKYENKIQRKRPFMVINYEATKKYGEVSSKRRKVGLRTLPYGYIDPDIDMDDQD
ncbi:uncharacterized protein LOC135848277 [Planococcus citri]|uniref:uncharacterized protein LOC135848277 n=1 Tax=Planococcus citri TaxID=170843 RepID=UPI0031F80B27